MQIVKKISVKEICGDVGGIMNDAIRDKKDFPLTLCQIFGVTTGIFSGEGGVRGNYEGLNGNFEAVNVLTGEESTAYKCFLPDAGLGFVRSLLIGADGKPVEFGVEIKIQPPTRDGSNMRYEYVVTPIGKIERSAKITALRERLQKQAE